MTIRNLFYAISTTLALAGCAAPTSQYYTLVPPAQPARMAAGQAGKPLFAIKILPVSVPEQVDRPQIVLSTPGSAQLTLLNGSLWAAPLPDQIRRALSSELTLRLGVLDISSGPAPEALALWRISVAVQRFDSVYGRHALLQATWRLEQSAANAPAPRICSAELRVPVGEGVAAMVQGHQQVLVDLAQTIAAQLSNEPLDIPSGSIAMKGCA